MTKEQKEKALNLIAKDCEIKHEYYCHGKTCAIGALAVATGFPIEDLEMLGSTAIAASETGMCVSSEQALILDRLRQHLLSSFGLGRQELTNIQLKNDDLDERWARQREICDYLMQIPCTNEAPV